MLWIVTIMQSAWELVETASPYLLLGLVIAALLHAFVPRSAVLRWLGTDSLRSVFFAALAGVPLPLCSCGVVPTAMGLRRDGASRGATLAFLISTPETGVDSIAVTYALIDPLMALMRPLAAVATALIAGFGQIWMDRTSHGAHAPTSPPSTPPLPARTWRTRLSDGFRFAFVTLLGDIAPTLAFGILLGGVLSVLIPEDFVQLHLGHGLRPMLIMLAIGIPMYVCAAASTPIAAALMLKGMSPGVALVFLLAGPATNITSLPVITRMLGVRSVIWYLAAIAGSALAFGALTDQLYLALGRTPQISALGHMHEHATPMRTVIAVGFVAAAITAKIVRDRRARKS